MREEMKVGDLVQIDIGRSDEPGYRAGIITGFDKDNDPVVCYYDQVPQTEPFYHYHVEVINEAN